MSWLIRGLLSNADSPLGQLAVRYIGGLEFGKDSSSSLEYQTFRPRDGDTILLCSPDLMTAVTAEYVLESLHAGRELPLRIVDLANHKNDIASDEERLTRRLGGNASCISVSFKLEAHLHGPKRRATFS
jgi:hypothetical protein